MTGSERVRERERETEREREGIGGGGGDKGSPGVVMGGAPERWCGGDGQDFAGVEYICTYL